MTEVTPSVLVIAKSACVTGVFVGVEVGVKVGVCVAVGVSVGVNVAVGVSVGVLVGVLVGVMVGVLVDVLVGVLVGVSVGVFVGVCEGVTEAVGVLVGVKVCVLVGVSVGVLVGVKVGVFVAVFVGVLVGVAVGAKTVTVLDPVLFASLISVRTLFGSTMAVLTRLPAEAGVTVKLTAKLPVVAPTVTDAPLAVQLNVPAVILQLILAEFVILTKLPAVGVPYVGPTGNGSLKRVCPLVKTAPELPLFETVRVHVKVLPATIVPLTLSAFVIDRSAARFTVWLDVFEVMPLTVAEAVFVTVPAVTSAAVIVYVALHVILSPTSNQSSRSPTVLTAGHVTVALSSVTVTGPSRGAKPLFVTT